MSEDLEIDSEVVAQWFVPIQEKPYVFMRISQAHVDSWIDVLGTLVRRCYVDDQTVTTRAALTGVAAVDIIAAKLPDPGAVMAGDFGEILAYLYQTSVSLPAEARGPKKWRLKQDRRMPAPHSDVVHFVVPAWPASSADDLLLCSEVKTKSTSGASTPIKSAIEDSAKDRTSRLAKTLVWLRERSLMETVGDIDLPLLERFIDSTNHPAAQKCFRAVAVVCDSLVAAEVLDAPTSEIANCTVVVIVVPELKAVYSRAFERALSAVPKASSADGAIVA